MPGRWVRAELGGPCAFVLQVALTDGEARTEATGHGDTWSGGCVASGCGRQMGSIREAGLLAVIVGTIACVWRRDWVSGLTQERGSALPPVSWGPVLLRGREGCPVGQPEGDS